MACDGYTKVWDLAAGELVTLDGARGTTLRVTRGTLWLTFERDIHDVVLEPGETFTIDRGGRTVIEAVGDAAVCVLARHVEEIRPQRYGRSFLATVARRLGWNGTNGIARRWAPYY